MVSETILQHWVFTEFILPFFLIFFIVFAILEKTKILGDGQKQLDALVAFVVGLIFVSAFQPKVIVGNLILFLTVALVVMFVALLLWGFVSGGSLKENILSGKVKAVVGILVAIIVIIALLWAAGLGGKAFDFLFGQSWSGSFWTNVSFIIAIAIALALVLKSGK